MTQITDGMNAGTFRGIVNLLLPDAPLSSTADYEAVYGQLGALLVPPVRNWGDAVAQFKVLLTPTATTAPVASGVGQPGQTLTVTSGAWTYQPTGYSYQVLRDGMPIATGTSYVVSYADQGHSLLWSVVATNDYGVSRPFYSNAIYVPAGNAYADAYVSAGYVN